MLFQTPKCLTKNGIHKTGKKIYTDLQLTFDDSVFINWIENIEEKIRDLVYEKRNIWFNNEPDREEIEYNWNSCLRTYKQKYTINFCTCHIVLIAFQVNYPRTNDINATGYNIVET